MNWGRSEKPFGRVWTPDMDDDLKRMVGAGLSFAEAAAEINAKYGTEFSRNAAIGRSHRLDFKGIVRPKREQVPKVKHISVRKARFSKPVVHDEQFTARLAAVEPLHVNLADLQEGQCRYPFGTGPYTFCGNPQCADSSYCDPHHILCTGEGTASERAVAPVNQPREAEVIDPDIQEAA